MLSKVCLKPGMEMPVFLGLLDGDSFESWKTSLCYLLSLGRDIVCASLGGIKVFSSALKLFGSMCRYYKFKIVSGLSIVNVAELFKTDGLVGFAKQVGLEWLLCLGVCRSSALVLKLSFLNSAALRFLFKVFGLGLWFKFAASRNERARASSTSQPARYFETAWFLKQG
ncbi:Precorrin-2 C(20)-methyltransferase [Candidatus Hodgkinia cicadicola]|nr:Precorrin-2 C(20)-methyltransferase [Candidatus Hodgkinia cicadicola]